MAIMGLAMLAYVLLDGYDLGVGMWMARADALERDVMVASIGPFWDANETWLVLGVGILLIAFPKAHGVGARRAVPAGHVDAAGPDPARRGIRLPGSKRATSTSCWWNRAVHRRLAAGLAGPGLDAGAFRHRLCRGHLARRSLPA